MRACGRLFILRRMVNADTAAAAAADVVVSLRAGPGRLTGEERDIKCEVGASSPSY